VHKVLMLAAALAVAPLTAHAEEAAPAEPPKFQVAFSGMVDAFYQANLDQPQSFANALRPAYEQPTGFNLNLAKLTAQANTEWAGFRLDLAFGPEGEAISHNVVEQAFVSVKLFGKATLDFGRFVTPAGFEVFESKDNWLYSKGLIFTLALPTAHEGVRLAVPIVDGLTVTGYLANGSDLFADDQGNSRSPYKTGILQLLYSKDTLTASVTGLISKDPVTKGDAYQVDALVTKSFGPLSLNVSGDYGKLEDQSFFAVGGFGRLSILGDKARIAGRVEYFDDMDALRTGLDANYTSLTAGVGVPFGSNVELKGELRYDLSSEDIFNGDDKAATATVAAIAWF